MTKAARVPPWFPPLSLTAIALLIWLVSFKSSPIVSVLHLSDSPLVPFSVSSQAFLLFMLVRAFFYWPPMVRWAKSMPMPHRVIFALMISSIIAGHFTLDSRTYFPLVAWEIFPGIHEQNPVTCREFVGTTESGKKVRLVVEQLFPSVVQINPLDGFTPDATDHLAETLAKAYNQLHADDHVRQVDLVLMAVNLHPNAGETRAQPSCQLLKRYDFSSGQ